jgi:hypothetical protein
LGRDRRERRLIRRVVEGRLRDDVTKRVFEIRLIREGRICDLGKRERKKEREMGEMGEMREDRANIKE